MKRFMLALGLMAMTLAALLTGTPVKASTTPTITFVNAPANGIVELAVGESYTLDIEVASDEVFIMAIAVADQYYPGRGIFYSGTDSIHQTSYGHLHLTMTGKNSTAELPDGIAPAAVVVGVRYKGGVVVTQRFDFGVVVR